MDVSEFDGGQRASFAAVNASLGATGGAVKWSFGTRDARQCMADESVAKRYAQLKNDPAG
jgi:hypothetical protein